MVVVLAIYLLLSLVLFTLYGWDKYQAIRAGQRIPEFRLQLLALLGGWPGAVLAQRIFRHKCSKRPFMIGFWVLVLLNISLSAVVVWLLPAELATLQTMAISFIY